MKELALQIPGYTQELQAPSGIPTAASLPAQNIVDFVIGILAAIAILAALGFIIWGGIMWVTSQGDKQKLEKARHTIIGAIIGLIIVIFAFVIISFIGKITGAPFLTQ